MDRTGSLPFDWERFFVPSTTGCVLACYAMSARYWQSFYPELNLPTDLEMWKEFADESFIEYRGTSIRDIVRKMPDVRAHAAIEATSSEEVEEVEEVEGIDTKPKRFLDLIIKQNTPNGLESLIPFFQTQPVIPQILVFDQLLMTHNVTGPHHAVILHSLDFEKEKLFVIDPTKVRLEEPDVYDFRLFHKAWRGYQNLQIITYPKGKITIISGPLVGIVHQPKITEYLGGHM